MKPKILRVRLATAAIVGRGAVMEHHIGFDSTIDGGHVDISFDKDPRFLRLDYGKEYFELLPISNVTSIMVEPQE